MDRSCEDVVVVVLLLPVVALDWEEGIQLADAASMVVDSS